MDYVVYLFRQGNAAYVLYLRFLIARVLDWKTCYGSTQLLLERLRIWQFRMDLVTQNLTSMDLSVILGKTQTRIR